MAKGSRRLTEDEREKLRSAVEAGAAAKGMTERDYADLHIGINPGTVSAAISGWAVMTMNARELVRFATEHVAAVQG